MWDAELAAVYDDVYAQEAEPSVVEPITGVLAELAGSGAALELAVGTGRIALALSARGIAVTGIELSPHMAGRLRAKPGADTVPVIVGDMTTTRAAAPVTSACTQRPWPHWPPRQRPLRTTVTMNQDEITA
jgi:16S rRNA A1518/A1519 N6-dimethyltransferase RsmA/KsgA/DIM1 with predicted DNA glycosylase/AP lyase activity